MHMYACVYVRACVCTRVCMHGCVSDLEFEFPYSLADLSAFIKETKTGLGVDIQEGDYDGLVEVMGHLLAVKDRQATTDVMFEPLKQTIDLLKTYEQEMSDEVHQRLQELPEQWNVVKKQAIVMKQNVAPLQANEVSLLRRKIASFDVS